MKYTTVEELLTKTKMTERELPEHLVICSQKYLSWLDVSNPHKAVIADCTTHKAIMGNTEEVK